MNWTVINRKRILPVSSTISIMAALRRRFSLEDKRKFLEQYDQFPKLSLREAASRLSIAPSLLWNLLQKRSMIVNGELMNRKPRVSCGKAPRMEATLWRWIDQSRRTGSPVTDLMIHRKAAAVAGRMGMFSFRPSPKWYSSFKQREALVRERYRIYPEVDHPDQAYILQDGSYQHQDQHQLQDELNIQDQSYSLQEQPYCVQGLPIKHQEQPNKLQDQPYNLRYQPYSLQDRLNRFQNQPNKVQDHANNHHGQPNQLQDQPYNQGQNNNHKDQPNKLEDQTPNFQDKTSNFSDQTYEVHQPNTLQNRHSKLQDQPYNLQGHNNNHKDQPDKLEDQTPNLRDKTSNFSDQTYEVHQPNTLQNELQDQRNSHQDQPISEPGPVSSLSIDPKMNEAVSSMKPEPTSGPLDEQDDQLRSEPVVITTVHNGDMQVITVPSLNQMREAMRTLATGLLYRGFCDFKLLHQFEKEVAKVVNRSVAQGCQDSFVA